MDSKIYFCGSIRGGRNDRAIYLEIISFLKKHAQVLTEHIGDQTLDADHSLTHQQIHDRDMSWLHEADLLVAEVTQPSLGVGYEIASALAENKPVYCLYNRNSSHHLSAMIAGSTQIQLITYSSLNEVLAALEKIVVP